MADAEKLIKVENEKTYPKITSTTVMGCIRSKRNYDCEPYSGAFYPYYIVTLPPRNL